MAAEIIQEAISVGAPAYNAGDIGLCAEIYQVAAQQLLQAHLSELSPQSVKDLQEALRRAQALGGAAAASGDAANQLAWSFRRAFDAQLRSGGARAGSTNSSSGSSVARVVSDAIAQGAPAYNRGDAAGCARIYASTARALLDRDDVGAAAKAQLTTALKQFESSGSRDANGSAWALRHALDASAAAGAGSGASAGGAVLAGGGAAKSGNLIADFIKGEGIGVSASVVNDTVMGGRSSSRVTSGSSGVVFEGDVTKRGGGGFASVRFSPSDAGALAAALRGKTGLSFDVSSLRGCRTWKIQLNEGYDGTTWQADFVAPTGSARSGMARIPFSQFVPTWRGMPRGRPGLTQEALGRIRTFGFMLSFLTADGGSNSGFEEGPFSVCIARVETY